MAKNEREMLQCTQIARLSCLTKGTMNLRIDGKEGPFTVEELISESVDFDEIRKNMETIFVLVDQDNAWIYRLINKDNR